MRTWPATLMSESPKTARSSRCLMKPMCLPLLEFDPSKLDDMRSQRFVKVVIWVVVAGMVLSLAVAAISLFS